MRSSLSSTELPPLRVGGGSLRSREILARFPAPVLPGFPLPDWTSGGRGTTGPKPLQTIIALPISHGVDEFMDVGDLVFLASLLEEGD